MQSIAFYGAFGFLCVLFCCLVTGCFCFCRSCCCCVRGGCCGKRFPTWKGNRGSCCFCVCCDGFTELDALLIDDNKDKDAADKEKDKDGGTMKVGSERITLGYSLCSRWTVRLWMFVYAGLVAAFITLGQVKGNLGLTESMITIARSPSGIVSTISSIQQPLRSFIVTAAADAVVPLLVSVNDTISGNLNVKVVQNATQCILHGIEYSLPDAGAIIGFIGDANNTMVNITGTATGLQSQITTLSSTLTSTQGVTTQLSGNMTALQTSLGTLNGRVTLAQISANSMDTYLTSFKDSTHGMPGISTRLNTASTNMPTQASADSARTGNSACLSALIAGSMDGNSGAADRTSLATKLSAISTKVAAVPDLDGLADDLAALNTQITNLRTSRLIDALSGNITLIKTAIDTMPQPSALSTLVASLRSAVNSVNLAPIRASLVTFNSTLSGGGGSAFNFTGVIREVNKIDGLGQVINCANDVVLEVEGLLLATMNSLPDMISGVTDMIVSINSTYQSARAQASSFRDTLNNLDSFGGAGFQLQTYIDLVDSLQSQLQSSSIINFDQILYALGNATTSLSGFNLATVLTNIGSLNTTVWDDSIMASPSSISNLRSLKTLLTSLGTNVGAASTKLASFDATLRCSGTTTTCSSAGSTAAPCSGGNPCTAAQRTCTGDGTSVCSQNSDCSGAGGTCPFDGPTFTAASVSLQAYSAAGPDAITSSISTLATSLGPASTTVTSTPALSTLFTQVAAFQTTVGNVLTPTIVNSVTSMSTQLDPHTLGLDTVNTAITNALSAINGIDLSTIKQQMVTFNSSFAPMKTQISTTLNMVGKAVDAMATFFSTTLPQVLHRLARPSLSQQATLTAVVEEIAAIGDDILAVVTSAAGSSFSLPISNVTNLVDSYLDYAKVLTDPSYAQEGPLFFFTSLPMLGMAGVNNSEAGAGGTVYKDSAGVGYAGGKKCFTDTCIVNTIRQLNQRPVGEAMGALSADSSSTPLSLPLSREQIMFLPFLVPLIIMLMGCCSASFCCGKRWQRVPACCSAFWICVVLPWLLIFALAIFWPLIMLISDTCRGAPNLGYSFVKGSEGAICNMLPGGALTSQGCSLTLQGQTITIPVSAVYGALLGSCANFPTALLNVYTDLGNAAAVIPGSFLNSTLDNMFSGNASMMGLSPKASLLAIPKTFGSNIGLAAKSLVVGFGDALSCDVLNADIARVTEGVCCSMLTSVYWYTSSFILIAFAMCLCGFPASILGYKRFPNQLWGPQFRQRLAMLGSIDQIISGQNGPVAVAGSSSARIGGTNVADEAMITAPKWTSATITPVGSPGAVAAQPSPMTGKTYNPANQPSPPSGSGQVVVAPRAMPVPVPYSPTSPGAGAGVASPVSHPPGTYYQPQTTTGDPAGGFGIEMKAGPPSYGAAGSPPSVGRPHYHGHGTPHHYMAVPQHASPNPVYPVPVQHRPSVSGGGFPMPSPQQQMLPPHIRAAQPYQPSPTTSAGYRG